MARFYRRYGVRRYGRYGRRYGRYRRYYRRSYARKYVNATSKSGLRIKCNQTYSTSATVGYGDAAADAAVHKVVPLDGTNQFAVTLNPLFQAYAALYEETRLIGMKVVLSVTSAVGGNDTPSLQIYTAFDRRYGKGEASFTSAEIKASASSTVATALNNNVAKITRSVYASDLIEKAQWVDSALRADNSLVAWVTANQNPNFFCPALFFFFNSPSLGATHSISYSASVTYYVAFRNPRYGGSSSSKDLPVKVVSIPDTAADVMDDGIDIPDELLQLPEPIDDVDVSDLTASEAVAALEKRRRQLKKNRAATSSHVPVTKTV